MYEGRLHVIKGAYQISKMERLEDDGGRRCKRERMDNDVDLGASNYSGVNPQLLEKLIGIHLISVPLFNYLKFRDLLNCSLVCKSWNTVAREVLREHRRCAAIISGNVPCQSVIDFNKLLINCHNSPFNGLTIATENTNSQHLVIHSCVNVNGVNINVEMNKTLKRRLKYKLDASNLFPEILRIKVRFLDMHWEDLTNVHCPAFQLIGKVLAQSCSYLQYLHIRSLPVGAADNLTQTVFGENPFPVNWLPNLQTFIPSCDYDDAHSIWEYAEFPPSIIKQLFSASPNLQQVLGEVNDEELDPYFEENKVHTLRSVRLELCQNFTKLQKIQQLFSPNYALNIKKLVFVISVPVPENKESVYEILRLIQERLGGTLEGLEISQVALAMLSNRRYYPFPRLKYLMIEYDPLVDTRGGFFTLTSVNFAWLFPNLESVDFEWGSLTIDLRIVTNEFDEINRNRSCPSVKSFYVSSCVLRIQSSDLVSWFAEMVKIFPNVKHFYLNEFRGQNFKECFECVWGAWADLETVTLRFDSSENMRQNFDSCFLGIDDEESVDLFSRLSEPGGIRDLQIVPIRPCIFNCKRLKRICFQIPPKYVQGGGQRRSLISDVAICLGLGRHPKVLFEVDVMFTNDKDHLQYRFPFEHLQRFVRKTFFSNPYGGFLL